MYSSPAFSLIVIIDGSAHTNYTSRAGASLFSLLRLSQWDAQSVIRIGSSPGLSSALACV